MTESEWSVAAEPQVMLAFLRSTERASDRKLRLFAAACCRSVWPLLTDERSRKAVEVLERYADDGAMEQERQAAWRASRWAAQVATRKSRRAAVPDGLGLAVRYGLWSAANSIEPVAMQAAVQAASSAGCAAANAAAPVGDIRTYKQVWDDEQRGQAALLRCLFGNPFRAPPELPASLLNWNDDTVVQIARRIYDERDWSLLPILADALEDAGLADTRVSEHLRGGEPHAKGCFVIDAILGKS